MCRGSLNLGYTFDDGTRIFVTGRVRSATFNLDELGFPAYDAHAYVGRDNTYYGAIGLTTHPFAALDTSLLIGRLVIDRTYAEPLEAADPNQATGFSEYLGWRTIVQLNNTLHLPDFSAFTNTALLFGGEHISDAAESYLNTNTDGFPYQQSVAATDSSASGHMGVQTTLWHRVTLTADAREDTAQYGGNAFTYRAGTVVALPELWSHVHATYGTGFRAPSLFDLFGVDSDGFVGNPNLKPETSYGYEAGWGLNLPLAGRANVLAPDVTYFYTRVHNLIQTVFNTTYTASTQENIDQALMEGVEASLAINLADWLTTTLSYTYTNAVDLSSNSTLLRRPRNQGTFNARIRPLPALTIAPELIYTGPHQDYLVDNAGFPGALGASPGGLLVNLAVTYDLYPSTQLFLTARNLAGSKWEPASGFATPGPSLLLGVRVTL